MCRICNSELIAGDKIIFADSVSGNCNICKSPFVLHSVKTIYNGASKTASFVGHNFMFDEEWFCKGCNKQGIDIDIPCDKYMLDISKELFVSLPCNL